MVTHQCVSCSRQHPLLAPAFCACGSTSFTALVVDEEPEAPTTSPDGGRKLEPAAAASTSGPTPSPSVSSDSASAPKPGAADESDEHDVGGVDCAMCAAAGDPQRATFVTETLEGDRYLCEGHASVINAPVRRL